MKAREFSFIIGKALRFLLDPQNWGEQGWEKKICQTSETILNNCQQVVTVTEFFNGMVIIEIELNYK